MSVHWQPYSTQKTLVLPAKLQPWLLDSGSFMQRLTHHGIGKPYVHVLNQAWQNPAFDECERLGVGPRQYVLVREVLIASREGQWMYARSVMPRQTLTGPERLLAQLKNRALGTLLFKNPNVIRGPFELARLQAKEAWHKKISAYLSKSLPELWARRSQFYFKHKSLLLAEVFLPKLTEL